jgi:hypothetical protein
MSVEPDAVCRKGGGNRLSLAAAHGPAFKEETYRVAFLEGQNRVSADPSAA